MKNTIISLLFSTMIYRLPAWDFSGLAKFAICFVIGLFIDFMLFCIDCDIIKEYNIK